MAAHEQLIGHTPMLELSHLARTSQHQIQVLCKAEFLNPGFSVKDRVVRHILDQAEQHGQLTPGSGQTIVAASSGNTGAAAAMMAAMRGYKAIITTSPKCSIEKMNTIRAYGAELIISPSGISEDHPEHYMNLGKKIAQENNYFDINQYENPSNPEAHYCSLGPEIWKQTNGKITHFVAAGSTGGTISGVGKFLKEMNPEIEVILADPVGSVFTNYFLAGVLGNSRRFLVEGVGKGSIPKAMNMEIIDAICPVTDINAFAMCRQLAKTEGLLVGGSSGLNVFAALTLANSVKSPSTIVTLFPDGGLKYLSKIYNEEWLKENEVYVPFPDFDSSRIIYKDEEMSSPIYRCDA